MKLKFATACVVTLLAGASESRALTFEGTISGTITSAQDASFILFGMGNTTPLTVGDVITGHYSYENPTADGMQSAFVNLHVGAINLNFRPFWFDVSGGHIDYFVWAQQNSSFPGEKYYGSGITVYASGFSVWEEVWVDGNMKLRTVHGEFTCSDPVTVTHLVPDTAATGPLFAFVLGALWYFRRHVGHHCTLGGSGSH